MERVAVLSHVKQSSVPPSLQSSGVRRIAWHGGKISSNKEEALQKFYQRKLQAGDHKTAQQIKATLSEGGALSSPNLKKLTGTHHQSKVTTSSTGTVLRTGRVLGPKLNSASKQMKRAKQQTARQPKNAAKGQKRPETKSASISLEDKLGLPLDALVGGGQPKAKRNMKRR
ncbi:hypothetical protein PHYBOEH_004829 [Phytophthora boehmeriae]|uniref:Uncharacterized protein n=1 Tax=Phytophthora boehmeriae TaxID=109152 RepID=A0A8T1WRZ7_9STRA|nr:hypothetical protein PHYBOEH_004829 [Phytophthora boehmeriae]